MKYNKTPHPTEYTFFLSTGRTFKLAIEGAAINLQTRYYTDYVIWS